MLKSVPAAALALALLTSGCGDDPHVRSRILYTCAPDICRMAPDGSSRVHLTHNGARRRPYSNLASSRDGKRIAFERGRQIYVADQDALHRKRLGFAYDGFSLAPSGNMWFGLRDSGKQFCRGTVDPLRYACQLLAHRLDTAAWGRDGSLLKATAHGVCTTRADGSCKAILIHDDRHMLEFAPAVSRDGRRLAVSVYAGDYEAIAVYDLRSRRFVRQLTDGANTDTNPSWSPDGRYLAFVRNGVEVVRIPAAGGAETVLARRVRGIGQVVWAG